MGVIYRNAPSQSLRHCAEEQQACFQVKHIREVMLALCKAQQDCLGPCVPEG